MEAQPETNATQNFGHQPDLRSTVKNALKMSSIMLLTSEKLQFGPQQHFLEDVGLGHHQS